MANGINKQVLQTGGGGGSIIKYGTFTIDFGTNTSQVYEKSQTITNTNCTTLSNPSITYLKAPSRDADEIEGVDFKIGVQNIANGSFDVYITDSAMQAEGTYTFTYTLL